MCVTHDMPCVNMYGTFEGYIYGHPVQFQGSSVRGEQQEEKGGRERRKKGKKKRKGRKEEKGRKMRKKEKEKRERKEKKEGVTHSEQTWTVKDLELHYKR